MRSAIIRRWASCAICPRWAHVSPAWQPHPAGDVVEATVVTDAIISGSKFSTTGLMALAAEHLLQIKVGLVLIFL